MKNRIFLGWPNCKRTSSFAAPIFWFLFVGLIESGGKCGTVGGVGSHCLFMLWSRFRGNFGPLFSLNFAVNGLRQNGRQFGPDFALVSGVGKAWRREPKVKSSHRVPLM